MKNKKEKEQWRKLDSSAKIFPLISNKSFSTIFRFSCVLKEDIDKEILRDALNRALLKYDVFKVKQKRGLFWYYFEPNDKKIIIEEENEYPCSHFDKVHNNKYLFKVSYFEKKINLEMFHSLTDGNTASLFFKELVYNYLDIKYNLELNEKQLNVIIDDANEKVLKEDSYLKNYDRRAYKWQKQNKAFIIRGKRLPFSAVGVTHGFMSTSSLKNIAKKYEATVTQYVVAKLIETIIYEKYLEKNHKEKITICVPVNLKKYYNSKSLLNFFLCAYIENDLRDLIKKNKEGEYEIVCSNSELFDIILTNVKTEFNERLQEENIKTRLAQDVKLGSNFFIRIIPLIIKRVVIQFAYDEIRKFVTMTFSNLGKIDIDDRYEEYIDKFLVLLAPEKLEKIKASAISYNDIFSFTFTSVLRDNNIERKFFDLLKKDGLEISFDGNGVYDVIS